jgi:hypothetical protein
MRDYQFRASWETHESSGQAEADSPPLLGDNTPHLVRGPHLKQMLGDIIYYCAKQI